MVSCTNNLQSWGFREGSALFLRISDFKLCVGEWDQKTRLLTVGFVTIRPPLLPL